MKKKFVIPRINCMELNPERDIMLTSANLGKSNAVNYANTFAENTKADYDYWSGKKWLDAE